MRVCCLPCVCVCVRARARVLIVARLRALTHSLVLALCPSICPSIPIHRPLQFPCCPATPDSNASLSLPHSRHDREGNLVMDDLTSFVARAVQDWEAPA